MFKESEHPRDKDGKFTDGSSGEKEKSVEDIAKEIFPHLRKKEKTKEIKAQDIGFEKKQEKPLTYSVENDKIKLPDIEIGRSLGAKARNWDVLDLSTGKRYPFVEGTHLQNVEVFAGGRSKTPYKKAYKYVIKGGKLEDWEHVKAIGWLDTEEGHRKAEVHWSQCKGFGKHDFFVKEWLDES